LASFFVNTLYTHSGMLPPCIFFCNFWYIVHGRTLDQFCAFIGAHTDRHIKSSLVNQQQQQQWYMSSSSCCW